MDRQAFTEAREEGNQAPASRTDWVIERIRRAILFGEAKAGERLVSGVWAQRLGVSPTPLREAFQRLAAEGFVDYDPQRGARVAPLTLRSACEIYELRILLEPLAVASSVAAGSAAWRAELEHVFTELDDLYGAVTFVDADAVETHRRFHRVVRSGCESAWLLRLVGLLGDQSTRMQFASLAARGGRRAAGAEHRAIFEAAAAGEGSRAAELTAAHLERTLTALRLGVAAGDPKAR